MAILGIYLSDFKGGWLSTCRTESKPIITKHTESKPTPQNSLIRFSTSILGTWKLLVTSWRNFRSEETYRNLSIGRPDDLAQKRHSSFIGYLSSRWRLQRMMQKLTRATCGGSPKEVWNFCKAIFFMAKKGDFHGKKIRWVTWSCEFFFWKRLMLIFGMMAQALPWTFLTRQVLRIRVSGRFIIHLSINLESKHWWLGSIIRTFWIQNLLAIRWPRVIQDPSKKLREYMTVYLKNQHFMVKIRKKSSPRTSPFAIGNFSLQVGSFVPTKWAVQSMVGKASETFSFEVAVFVS